MKRPQDARRALRSMWESVYVCSCADGTIKIEPQWNKKRFGVYSDEYGGGPGVFSRMAAANMVRDVLNINHIAAAGKKVKR